MAEEKNLDEAIRLLESYLRLVPKDRKEQLHLGLLYAEKPDDAASSLRRDVRVKNPSAAFITLEEVLRTADDSLSQEELHKARRKLVDMAMLVGRAPDAETHLAVLMKETPDDPELLELDGQILVIRKQDEEACEQFRRAIEMSPPQIDSYVLLADDSSWAAESQSGGRPGHARHGPPETQR